MFYYVLMPKQEFLQILIFYIMLINMIKHKNGLNFIILCSCLCSLNIFKPPSSADENQTHAYRINTLTCCLFRYFTT